MLSLVKAADFMRMLTAKGHQNNEFAMNALSQLHDIVHIQRIIDDYIVQNADMDQAQNVFVRVNSGGEPLSLSDILMSTAIANWRTRDAREAIFGLVDQISAKGFFINKDFVLKACLFLYSTDIRYKVSNFTPERVKPFEENWDAIHRSIHCAFDFIKDFGYTDLSHRRTLSCLSFTGYTTGNWSKEYARRSACGRKGSQSVGGFIQCS